LAKSNNGSDSVDIGFYGLYDTSGSQDLYAGLFRDASDSGKFKLFKDLQVEPTTTVNTSGTGYAVGTLVAGLEVPSGSTVTLNSDNSNPAMVIQGSGPNEIMFAADQFGNANDGVSLLYRTTPNDLEIVRASGQGVIAKFNGNTGVAELWHANAGPKLATTSTGVTVGGTLVADGVSLGDNEILKIGNSDDFQILHNGSQTALNNLVGNVIFRNYADDADIDIMSDDGSGGTATYFRADGSTGQAQLFYYGTEKFKTLNAGAELTGNLTVNNGTNLQVLLNAGDGCIEITRASGGAFIDFKNSTSEDNDARLQESSGHINLNGNAIITTGNLSSITSTGTLTGLTTSGAIDLSQTSGVAIKTTGNLSSADLTLLRASGQTNGQYGFDIKYMGSRTGNNNSYSLFMHNQTGTDVEAMTVFQDGKVGINQTTPTAPLHVGGAAIFDDVLEAGVLEGKGGVTYDPPGSSGTDTATDVGLALHSGKKIVLGDQGFIRTIVDATWASALKIGQSGTNAFTGTEIYGGNAGVTLKYGADTKLVTNSDGVQILDAGAGSTATLELGTESTTERGLIKLNGSTANKYSTMHTSNGNLHIDSASVSHGVYLNWYTSDGGSSTSGTFFGNGNSGQVGRIDGSGNLTITGALSAATKSFDIEHPTKHNMRLKHGSLEGPEHGVYVRGILTDENVIELPDYWTGLVHEDSITAQLTPKGHMQQLYVKEIKDNKVYVENTSATKIDCFYFIQGNRKDTEGFEVEYES
jgi:hypothetical protein